MDYLEKATKLHESGCNCCQAVIMCVAEKYGLTEEQAYRLGAFFGGGMRCGEVCGAVTGGLMALGLEYGDENNRQCGASKAFQKAFKDAHGSIICRELLAEEGQQITHIPSERTQAYYRKRPCKELVSDAVLILEEVCGL